MKTKTLILFCLCFAGLPVLSVNDVIEFSSSMNLEREYAVEQRDDLKEGGLYTASFEAAWHTFELGHTYVDRTSKVYPEYQVSHPFVGEWESFAWLVGYTHPEIESDSPDDDASALDGKAEPPFQLVAGGAAAY